MKNLLVACLFNITSILCAAPSIDNWQWRNPLPSGDSRTAPVWANGALFAPCGQGLLRSTDGTNWSLTVIQPGEVSLAGLAFGNGTYVAVGRRSISCVVETSGTILTSQDGLAWSDQTAGLPGAPTWLISVTYGNGLFVALGGDAVGNTAILTSADGTNWASQAFPFGPVEFAEVAASFAGDRFFVCGSGPAGIVESMDGTNWITTDASLGVFYGVVFAKNLFVASGNLGPFTSSNGVNWTRRTNLSGFSGIAYGGETFTACGSGGKVLTSTDGLNWYKQSSGVAAFLKGITFASGLFVADGTGVFLISRDGTNWANVTPGWVVNDLNQIQVYMGRLIAVGASGTILNSTDALGWISLSSGVTNNLNGLTSGAGTVVAVGDKETVLVSAGGQVWAKAQTPGSARLWDVTYGNGQFVAVGDAGTILTSSNTWDWVATSSMTSAALFSVAFGDGIYVAAGLNSVLLVSTNGSDWLPTPSGVASDLAGVRYVGGRFLAAGSSGTLLASANGLDWSVLNSGTCYSLSGISYASGVFVVCGDRGTVLGSADGVNWFNCPRITQNYLFSVAPWRDTFMAVGLAGNIMQSGGNVILPMVLGPVARDSAGSVSVGIAGPVGHNWDVLVSPDLANWSLLTNFYSTLPSARINDSSAAHLNCRFYRGRWR